MQIGNITAEDLQLFLGLSDLLFDEADEAQQVLIENAERIFAKDCARPLWCHLYELPIRQHAFHGLTFLEDDFIQQASQSPNQIQFMLESLQRTSAEIDDWKPTGEEKEALRTNLASIFALSYSLVRSFHSLQVFGLYLNDLVAIVRSREERSKWALLSAVKIDPTVLGCPSVGLYVSQRVLLNDSKFLRSVKRAIGGKFSALEQRNYQKVRMVLQVLREVGAKRLSAAELYELFVEELALIARDRDSDKGSVEESLRQFAYQFMKRQSVS